LPRLLLLLGVRLHGVAPCRLRLCVRHDNAACAGLLAGLHGLRVRQRVCADLLHPLLILPARELHLIRLRARQQLQRRRQGACPAVGRHAALLLQLLLGVVKVVLAWRRDAQQSCEGS
jgi:hypothetical protein